jgi:hypothetical protein
LIPTDNGSCSSETKQDRRKLPISKLFTSDRILQKKVTIPTNWLDLIPDEDFSVCLETKHYRRTVQKPTLFVSMMGIQEERPQSSKISPSFESW